MRYGCRECALGPCYIERNTLASLVAEDGRLKEDVNIPEDGTCTIPQECLYFFVEKMRFRTLEILTRRELDWGVFLSGGYDNRSNT